jgi:hypothetical protein
MQHSSKYNLCPVCGRNTDDKCRWNDSTILCYYGDLFHPPKELSLGQFLRLGETQWKLISYYAGFSNGSYLFAKVDISEFLSPLQQQRKKMQVRIGAKKNILEYKDKFIKVRKMLHQCLATKDPQHLRVEEIAEAKKVCTGAIKQCSDLLAFIADNKACMTIKKSHVFALRHWGKMLDYELRELINFERFYLGVLDQPPAEPVSEDGSVDWF